MENTKDNMNQYFWGGFEKRGGMKNTLRKYLRKIIPGLAEHDAGVTMKEHVVKRLAAAAGKANHINIATPEKRIKKLWKNK